MHSFEVTGGKKLKGEIIPQGAKNEALQIINAVLLTSEKVTISNIPDILDVNLLIDLLGEMGVKIERPSRDTAIFQAANIDIVQMDHMLVERNLYCSRAPPASLQARASPSVSSATTRICGRSFTS